VGFCTGMARYRLTIAPKSTESVDVFIPMANRTGKAILETLDYDTILTETIAQWRDRLDHRGLQIQVPDPKVQAAFQSNRSYLLVFDDGDSITPGPFSYHYFWYRDAAYMVNALDRMGFHEESRQILLTYPQRSRKEGGFCSQKGEWDSAGQAIWTLIEHYRFTRDADFLEKVYPSIQKGMHWIEKNLFSDKDPLLDGLHAPGLSAEHFGGNDYYYWDNFWSCAGLRDGIFAAESLGKTKDVHHYEAVLRKLQASIDRSLKEVERRIGKPIIPISPSPSRRMDSAAIGSLSAVYPLRLLPLDDARFLNTLDYLETHCSHDGGFFHDVVHSGYGTYLNLHMAECYTFLRNKEKAWSHIRWMLDKATDTFTWPEAINPQNFGGNMGDGHHGWAAADFLIQIRNLLFFEEDQRLIFLPAVPDSWFQPGKKILVDNGSTYFGSISFRVRMLNEGHAELESDFNFHRVPEQIEVCLPSFIQSLRFKGMDYPAIEGKVVLDKALLQPVLP
jgi:GH15 family glucan-1,4-alpha-glucosidase